MGFGKCGLCKYDRHKNGVENVYNYRKKFGGCDRWWKQLVNIPQDEQDELRNEVECRFFKWNIEKKILNKGW